MSFSWSSGFNSVSFVLVSQLLTELSWFNSVGGCSCTEAATGGTNGSGDGSATGLTSVYASGRVDRARCPCKLLSITVTALGVPGNCCVGCCNRDIAVPWKDPCDVVELGLWSMLSTAAVVKTPVTACGGHTTPSDSNLAHRLFPTSVDIAKVWS